MHVHVLPTLLYLCVACIDIHMLLYLCCTIYVAMHAYIAWYPVFLCIYLCLSSCVENWATGLYYCTCVKFLYMHVVQHVLLNMCCSRYMCWYIPVLLEINLCYCSIFTFTVYIDVKVLLYIVMILYIHVHVPRCYLTCVNCRTCVAYFTCSMHMSYSRIRLCCWLYMSCCILCTLLYLW